MRHITLSINKKLKEYMAGFEEVNWQEVIKSAVINRLNYEKINKINRNKNPDGIKDAVRIQDGLSSKTSGSWSGANEIRKWRDKRHDL